MFKDSCRDQRSLLGWNPGSRRTRSALALSVAILLLAETVEAGVQGGPGSCLADEFGGSVGCTANDVTLAQANVISVIDGCTSVADTAVVEFSVTIEINAAKRYRPAFWISTDGGDAESGVCFKEYLAPPLLPTPTQVDLETGSGPYADLDGDQCGDGEQNDVTVNPIIRTVSTAVDNTVPTAITLPCRDSDSDGVIDFTYCAGWDQNADGTCTSIAQAGIPGNSSKCKCGLVSLPGVLVPPITKFDGALSVVKTVMIAGGVCGVDDVAGPLNLPIGTQVEFCYSVTAIGDPVTHEDVLDVVLIDDMATATTGDDLTVSLFGLTDIDGDLSSDDLQAGQTATGKSPVVSLQ